MSDLAAPAKCWRHGIACPIHADRLLTEHVNIPDHHGSRRKIIGALRRYRSLRGWPIVVLASDLGGKRGRALDELTGEWGLGRERGVRAERTPVGKADHKSDVIGDGVAAARAPREFAQAGEDLTPAKPGSQPVGDIKTNSPPTSSAFPSTRYRSSIVASRAAISRILHRPRERFARFLPCPPHFAVTSAV